MMGGHHALTGAAAWLALTAAVPAVPVAGLHLTMTTGLYSQTPAVALVGSLICAGWALMADADHSSATISHSVPILGKLTTSAISDAAGGHRKGTHTIWAVIAAAALAWFAHLFVWNTGSSFGVVNVGTIALTVPAVAFASHAIKLIGVGHSWVRAWIAGAAAGLLVTVTLRQDIAWLPLAVVLGYAIHLAGDMLTTGGIAPLFPLLPKPPASLGRVPLLTRIWQENGYISLPVLGDTGSVREWALALVLGGYVAYVAFYEIQQLVGVSLAGLHA